MNRSDVSLSVAKNCMVLIRDGAASDAFEAGGGCGAGFCNY